MKIKLACLALALTLAMTGQANAMAIDYIFNGTGTGDLNGTAFNGTFNVTYIGDTVNVTTSGVQFSNNAQIGSFTTPSLAASFDTGINVRIDNTTPSNPLIGFGQTQPSPVFFVAEAGSDPALAGYDLKTAFPITPLAVNSGAAQTFLMANSGQLTFNSISALSFSAVTPGSGSAAPLPPALPMFAAALMGLAYIAYQRRRA